MVQRKLSATFCPNSDKGNGNTTRINHVSNKYILMDGEQGIDKVKMVLPNLVEPCKF